MDPEISKSYMGYTTFIPILPCNVIIPLISNATSAFALDLPMATEFNTSIVFAVTIFAFIFPVILISPLTSNVYDGFCVPIPTLPDV